MNQIVLKELISLTKGKKPQTITSDEPIGFLPYVDIKAFETNIIEKYTDGEKCIECNDGDLLIVCDGSRSGLIGKAVKGYVGSTLARIDCDSRIDKDYLYYFIQSKYMLLNSNVKGTGTPHLKQDLLKSFSLILPSIEKQKQIVKQIEESLSQLDSAVETLNKTKQQLEIYRQAVLKEAFSGELTKPWRDKHSNADATIDYVQPSGTYKLLADFILYDLPQGWKWVHIGDITKGTEYGTSQKSLKCGKVPVIRMGNLQNGIIDWADLSYSNDDNEIQKYQLKYGDVLFNRTNSPELVGKTAIYKGERKAIFAGYLIRINQIESINSDYLNYYLNSQTARAYGNKVKTDGVNQSNINGKKLCTYPFPICSRAEQDQVVYELKSRLSMCDYIEDTVNQSLQQAEALRQSILKQAFEGNDGKE